MMKDFFISYTSADLNWAEWIAWHLEEAGYEVEIQTWDSQAGKNFIEWMDQASKNTKQTIAVISPAYFTGKFSVAEWTAAFYKDKLLPIRIQDFDIEGLFGPTSYIDLVGLDEEKAKNRLIEGVKLERKKPHAAPRFPESIQHTVTKPTRFPGGLPSISNIPFNRNLFFTGREEIINDLHRKIASSQLQVLCGIGGIGKTQTAIEYAYRFCNDYDFILWVTADPQHLFFSNFAALADKTILDLPEQKTDDQQKILDAVSRWLKEHTNWLLIFDNADNPGNIKDYIPGNPEGHILLTSRAQVFDQLGITNPIEITKMSPDEAQKFLIRRTGRIDVSSKELDSIKQLCDELDYLPLALEQAAAYITKKKSLFEDYLISYNKRGLKLLEKSEINPDKYPRSVGTTWLISFEQVENSSKASADLLRTSVFLHCDRIPIEVITTGKKKLGYKISKSLADYDSYPVVLDELMEPLTEYSLIRRDIQSRTYSIHRLVQRVYREMMDTHAQNQWAKRTIRALNQTFSDLEFSSWGLCERLLPHAQICAEHIANFNFRFMGASELLHKTAVYLHYRDRYAEAEPLCRQALAIEEGKLVKNPYNISHCLNSLAILLMDQGKYAEAESLCRRALRILKGKLIIKRSYWVNILNNLANSLFYQDKYAEAEPLYRRALNIYEAKLGKDHPLVATNLNNLMTLLCYRGKYAEAEPLCRRALDITEAQLGKDHPHVATSLNNLAELLQAQGKYDEAETLYRHALDIDEKKLGKDHPNTVMVRNNLMELLEAIKTSNEK